MMTVAPKLAPETAAAADGDSGSFTEMLWESSVADPDRLLSSLRREQKLLSRSSEHYRQIGQVLSIAEAAVWKVGVPALTPSSRIAARKSCFSGKLDEFLKQELVGVPTTTLEFYVEDLDNLTDDASSLESLSVSNLTMLERIGIFSLFAPVVYAFSAFALTTQLQPASAWLAALVPLCVYVGLVSILASDTYRRASFSIILGNEILRRRGGDAPGASNLQICPT